MLNEAGWPLLKWDESKHPRGTGGKFTQSQRRLLRMGVPKRVLEGAAGRVRLVTPEMVGVESRGRFGATPGLAGLFSPGKSVSLRGAAQRSGNPGPRFANAVFGAPTANMAGLFERVRRSPSYKGTGTVLLGGRVYGAPLSSSEHPLTNTTRASRRAVALHEALHSVDLASGKKSTLSSHPDFVRAFLSERYEASTRNLYGASNRIEAFAEAARAIMTPRYNPSSAAVKEKVLSGKKISVAERKNPGLSVDLDPSSKIRTFMPKTVRVARRLLLAARYLKKGLRKASFLDVERAAAATNATPTQAQVAAGNYKKGAVKLHGLTIRIENPAGSVRHGVGRDGKEWSATMPAHYGYISGTKGFDGDEVDVWIGPVPDLAHVYVINQLRLGTDRFDEHKVGMGFHHESDFLSVYRMAYPNLNADDLIHDVVRMPVWRLKRWLASGRPAKQMAKMAEVSSGRHLKSRLAAMYCKAHGRDLALFGPYIGVDGRRRVVVQDKETKRKWSVAYAKVKLEALTGKPLEPGLEADHKNNDRTNDAARNLVALDSYENKVKHGKYRRSLLKWDEGGHPRGEGGRFTAGQRSMAARGVPASVVSKYPGFRVSPAGRAKTGQVPMFGGATDADAFYSPATRSAKHTEHAGRTWSRNEALIALAHRNVKTPVRGGGIFVFSRNLPSLGGKRPTSAQMKSLAIHEFGHLVDAKSRGGKKRFSAHPDFLRAYARDEVTATAHDRRVYDKAMADLPNGAFSGKNDGAFWTRILRSMKSGYWKMHPQEAFAEAFRTITDRRFASSEMSDHIRDRRYVAASMPNVVRVARKLLLRKDFSGVERAAAQTNTIPTLAKAKQRLNAEDVATLSEGRIARMIERTMSWVRDDVIDDIIAGLKAGADPAEVAREVAAGEGLSEKLNSAADALEAVYAQAGQEAADQSGGKSRKLVAFQFDARNPKSATYFDEYRLWLVREMSAEQEATIQTIAREGILSGKSLDAVARDLRVTVGLTAYQARNVMNYRRELEDLEPAAMLRALRDRRYDSTIRRAIESGDALTPEQITKMVEAYHRRYVAYRSVTIARTEGLRAANMGVMASAYQAINDGVVQPQDVVKRWIAKIDDKTRDSHAELNGQQIRGVDSPFRASSGALLAFPGDPSAPAAETINCRCSLAFTMLPPNS